MSIDKAGLYYPIVSYSYAFDAMPFVLSLIDCRSFLSVALPIVVQIVFFFSFPPDFQYVVWCTGFSISRQRTVFVSPRF